MTWVAGVEVVAATEPPEHQSLLYFTGGSLRSTPATQWLCNALPDRGSRICGIFRRSGLKQRAGAGANAALKLDIRAAHGCDRFGVFLQIVFGPLDAFARQADLSLVGVDAQ